MIKVFVYGSLLSGMGNHGLLSGSQKLGDATSPKGIGMVDLGAFPGAIDSDESTVVGEVYEVDDPTFKRLDRLEGYNPMQPKRGLYDRKEIETPYGPAYIYMYNWETRRREIPLVPGGDWRKHYNAKFKRI